MIKGLSARIALSLAVLGAVAAGCTTGGTATPGPTTGTTSTEQTSKSTTSSSKPSDGGESLADLDPCAVLESVKSQLDLSNIEKVDEKECGAEVSTTAYFGLTKQPELAIADAVGDGKKTDVPIGSHKAKLVEAPAGKNSCLLTIEVAPTSRVDIIAVANASGAEACELATRVATAIEPKLPK
ncbi:DUF3558 family protein [Saccharothrix carnea]|uniref:DUF3558 family protein n=1 Tax=Saccharothrix carnea TaxID=1280637 RepID=UPI000D0CFA2F|nr:DUF3558 family protein [Saccharothrix carnea]